jgi:hypothetical protein
MWRRVFGRAVTELSNDRNAFTFRVKSVLQELLVPEVEVILILHSPEVLNRNSAALRLFRPYINVVGSYANS